MDELLKKKFDAAVKTIQNLPKNGSYQPSNTMKLKFYSLFKQATIGPVNISRPGMFDPVGRAKWDAWKSLGDMSADEAMQAYVDEIVAVAENMEDSPERDQFLAVMAEKPAVEQPDQAPSMTTESDELYMSANGTEEDTSAEILNGTILSSSPAASSVLSETDNEDFCDTLESLPTDDESGSEDEGRGDNRQTARAQRSVTFAPGTLPAEEEASISSAVPVAQVLPSTAQQLPMSRSDPGHMYGRNAVSGHFSSSSGQAVPTVGGGSAMPSQPITVGYISSQEPTATDGRPPLTSPSAAAALMAPTAVALQNSLQSLTNDVSSVNARLADVEAGLQGLQHGRVETTLEREGSGGSWWPFEGWNHRTVLAFLLWPFLANFILRLAGRGRRTNR